MIRRVHLPRWSTRGDPIATFYPKTSNRWSCRVDDIWLRKWRGNRSRTWLAFIKRGLAGWRKDEI